MLQCCFLAALSVLLSSCAAPKDRSATQHTTLPSRDVTVTLPFVPKEVFEAAERTLRDDLGYTLTDTKFDAASRTGRIEGTAGDGGSARVLVKPGRAYETAILQVFAAPKGARVGDAKQADAVLTRIEDTIWNAQAK